MDVISTIKHEPIKEEPNEVPLNFLYPDDQPKQSCSNDKNRASYDDSVVSACVFAQPTDQTNHEDILDLDQDGNDKESITSASALRFPNDNPVVRSFENASGRDEPNDPNLDTGHLQHNIPDNSRSQNSLPSDDLASRKNGSKHLFMSTLYDKSVGSKHEENQQLENVLNCMTIPVEELSHFEQISIKTDEVFISDVGNNEIVDDVLGLGTTMPQTEDHSALDVNSGFRKTKRKSHVYNGRTMQTRTSSGSLPKSPRIPYMIENDWSQRLGHKKYACTLCNESFQTRVNLRKHISDVHDGVRKSADPATFICPVCDITCKRKFGLKRHLTSKHLSAKNICCIKCGYKAKNYQDYLKHIDKHDSTEPTSIPVKMNHLNNEVLKCHECHEIFNNNDIFNLHTLNHKVAISLSGTEHSMCAENSSNCKCFVNSSKMSNSSHCVLNLPFPSSSSNSNNNGCQEISLSCLPQELKSETEKSLDIIFKLTSKLGSLTQSIRADYTSPSSQNLILLPAINQVSSLSSELTNLTMTLGHTLLLKKQVKAEVVQEERNINLSGVHGEGNACKIKEKNEEIEERTLKKKKIVKSSKSKIKRRKRGRPALKSKKQSRTCKSNVDHDSTCQECGRKLRDQAGLRRHMVIHCENRLFECNMCEKSFYRREHLTKHLVTHSEERPFRCEICNYTAKTAQRLQRHSHTHEKGQNRELQCTKCSFQAHSAYVLSKHEDKHKPCSLCGYEAVDVDDYKSHRRSHFSYSCSECKFFCFSKWQLQRHSKRKHNHASPEDGKFFCELCGYSCLDKRQFRYHMIRHENKTPFSCQDCDYKCSSRTSLENHKLMHAGLRPYLCSFCGASFRRTSHLNNHMLIHRDVKKHACRTCGRRFRARYNLKMHEMLHTGEKQFKCHLCDFACRRNKELRLHISKHDLFDDKDIKPLPLESQSEDGTVTV